MNPVSDLHVERIARKCKAVLGEQYGKQLKGVILFGPTARGNATGDSDIDLLVLIEKPFDFFVELRRLVDILYPIQLESEKLLSAKPVYADDFEKGTVSLYRIARREGVFIK